MRWYLLYASGRVGKKMGHKISRLTEPSPAERRFIEYLMMYSQLDFARAVHRVASVCAWARKTDTAAQALSAEEKTAYAEFRKHANLDTIMERQSTAEFGAVIDLSTAMFKDVTANLSEKNPRVVVAAIPILLLSVPVYINHTKMHATLRLLKSLTSD
jgi:hypothetical protein